jgi:photosystem II stability/assembly factor-like uncharacterized protein
LPTSTYNGLASGLAFDPLVAGRILLATVWGIFASEDGGTTWSQRDTGINGATVDRVISIAPMPPYRTFAVGVQAWLGLHAYDLGAQRWSAVQSSVLQPGSSGDQIYTLGYGEAAPDTLYAGGSRGLFRSLDGGQTWSKTAASFDGDLVRAIAVSAANPQTLYVSSEYGVLFSADGGSTFVPRSSGLPPNEVARQILVDPENQNRLYVSLESASPGIYRTSDGGLSWEVASTGIGSNEVFRIANDPEDFAILYAATPAGLMKSTDSGDTWTALPGNHFVSDVAVDRHDGAQLLRSSYLVPNGGTQRSVDGGRTWEILPRSTYGIPRGVAFDYTTPASVMTIVDRGGVETLQVVPDLEITSASTGAAVHSPVDVQVTVRNRGPFAASRVVLTASIPRTGSRAQTPRGECVAHNVTGAVRCDLGYVYADEALTITFDLPEFFPGDDSVRFEALAREPDPDLANNRLTLPVERQSDVSVSIAASASTVVLDQTVRFVLTVSNGDFSPAENVQVSVQLPPSLEWSEMFPLSAACIRGITGPTTCSLGTLNRHSSTELVVTAIARAAGSAVVSASATSQGTDPLPANNSVSTTVNVTTPPPVSAGSGGGGGGGGGGGSVSWAGAWALAILTVLRHTAGPLIRREHAPARRRRQSLTA